MPKLIAKILQKLTSEKFAIQLTLLLLTALVKSTTNRLDDQALGLVRKALEEE
jgi:hypothetical protein|tara:strand:- start:140 stop:298 length:159 start_codon:yes stop_codon:yes gene_type:complete